MMTPASSSVDLAALKSEGPILVWGAGAVGGTIGAYWSRSGLDVVFVDADMAHVEAMNAAGLSIEGPVEAFNQRVTACTPGALTGRYARVVLAVKAPATADATRQLLPHLSDDGYVLSAQNGLNELDIASIAGSGRVMGCFVNFGADYLAPGRILRGNRAAVVVGEVDGRLTPRLRSMHALLRLFEPEAELTDDIWAYLWGKLGYGALLFATALTNASIADALASPRHAPVYRALAREVLAVAAAKGVRPRGFNGFDPAAFEPGASVAAATASLEAMTLFNRGSAKSHSGIWRDLAVRRRRTEVDAQVGVVVRLGAEAGVPTPALARLATLVHDIEDGRREQGWAALDALLLNAASGDEPRRTGSQP